MDYKSETNTHLENYPEIKPMHVKYPFPTETNLDDHI